MPAADRATRTGGSTLLHADRREDLRRLQVHGGQQGRAQRAPRPDNAIYALAGAIKALEEYRFEPMINPATRAFFERIARERQGLLWRTDQEVAQRSDRPRDRRPARSSISSAIRGRAASPRNCPAAMPPTRFRKRPKPTSIAGCFPGVAGDGSQGAPDHRRQGRDRRTGRFIGRQRRQPDPGRCRHRLSRRRQDQVCRCRHRPFAESPARPTARSCATPASRFTGSAGLWGYLGEPLDAHGLDERVLIEGFHDQVPIIADLLRRVAG